MPAVLVLLTCACAVCQSFFLKVILSHYSIELVHARQANPYVHLSSTCVVSTRQQLTEMRDPATVPSHCESLSCLIG